MLEEFPKSAIYVIPARLDDNETDDERLLEIHRVDLFPNWGKGLQKILQAIRVEADMPLKDASIKSGVKNSSFHDFGISNRGNISFRDMVMSGLLCYDLAKRWLLSCSFHDDQVTCLFAHLKVSYQTRVYDTNRRSSD